MGQQEQVNLGIDAKLFINELIMVPYALRVDVQQLGDFLILFAPQDQRKNNLLAWG